MTITPNPHTDTRQPGAHQSRPRPHGAGGGRSRRHRRIAPRGARARRESWHRLASARGTFSAADAAKILSRDPAIALGQNRLFRALENLHWAYRQRRDRAWRARQSAVDCGWLTEIPQSHHHPRTGELLLDPSVGV